jgi:ubiquitin C-terminal hydrolase
MQAVNKVLSLDHTLLQLDESGMIFIDEAYHNKPLLPPSLKNTGNTCFLNATLQTSLSCFSFVQIVQLEKSEYTQSSNT